MFWIALLLHLLLGDVAIAFCACRSLMCLSSLLPGLITPLHATLLTTTHREGHE